MNSVFGSLHHLRMRLQPDKNQKNQREKVFRFYCWQHISVHISGHGCDKWIRSSVVCIIYGCAYSQIKIRKIGEKKFFVFTVDLKNLQQKVDIFTAANLLLTWPFFAAANLLLTWPFFAAANLLLTWPFFAAANLLLTWPFFCCSKFTANLTIFCCSKITANLTELLVARLA